uniref:Uncharacterized protein AlNc14C19G1988 n=1 Tax=Albugo laibachii Nc14 TaxID=890382 RepID=F0W517_9STRA|nr:conserved hypothetical protein [Albugo laibachii Nc14]|eukprot:CCA16208.1 conserved hypothetical protein [Albugo laibachii Nc14]
MALVAHGTLKEDARSLDVKPKIPGSQDKLLKESEGPVSPKATLGSLANLLDSKPMTPAPIKSGSRAGAETLPGTIKPAGGNPGDCKFQVSVQSDATYCLEEEPCSGSGPQPYATGCPMKDAPATSDCHCFLPSFVSKGKCVAPKNAICSNVEGSTWGCTFGEKGKDKNGSEPTTKGGPEPSPKAKSPEPIASPKTKPPGSGALLKAKDPEPLPSPTTKPPGSEASPKAKDPAAEASVKAKGTDLKGPLKALTPSSKSPSKTADEEANKSSGLDLDSVINGT